MATSFLKVVGFDWLSMAVVAGVSFGLGFTPLYRYVDRSVRIELAQYPNGTWYPSIPPELQHRYQRAPISTAQCAFVVLAVPLSIITCFQYWLRSPWDFWVGGTGVFKAVISMTLVNVVLKHVVGGFRPYFMDVCKPSWPIVDISSGHSEYFFYPTDCSVDMKKSEAGHTSTAFASAIFLSFYLNGKLKTFSDHSSHFWTFIVTILPLLGASWIGYSMLIYHQHHADDVIVGTLLGSFFGTLAYRSSYAAILDHTCNHIPLPPWSAKVRLIYCTLGQRDNFDEVAKDNANQANELVVWKWWRQTDNADLERNWLYSLKKWLVQSPTQASETSIEELQMSPDVLTQASDLLLQSRPFQPIADPAQAVSTQQEDRLPGDDDLAVGGNLETSNMRTNAGCLEVFHRHEED